MESKNTFILHETEAFMRGELDNVTVEMCIRDRHNPLKNAMINL